MAHGGKSGKTVQHTNTHTNIFTDANTHPNTITKTCAMAPGLSWANHPDCEHLYCTNKLASLEATLVGNYDPPTHK